MADQRRAHLLSQFQLYDTNKNGCLTVDELRASLHNGSYVRPFSYGACRMMMDMYDWDRNGNLKFEEYFNLRGYLDAWSGHFNKHDTNRSGHLQASEFHAALSELGYNLSSTFYNILMKKLGTNNTVAFDSFLYSCIVIQSLTNMFRRYDPNGDGIMEISYVDYMKGLMSIRSDQ